MARAAVQGALANQFDGEFVDLLPLFRSSLFFKGIYLAADPYGSGYGIEVCGIPVGDETFVRYFVDGTVDTALDQIRKPSETFRCAHHQLA